jgi:hypothetical protein
VSAISLLLLATAVASAAVAGAALHSARDLRRRLDECARDAGDRVPHARSAEEIHSIVVEAIAEERERELAEARAVWRTQESGAAGADDDATLAGRGTEYEIAPVLDALLRGRVDDEVLRGLRELRDRDLPGRGMPGRDMPGPGIFVPRQSGPDLEPMDHGDLTDRGNFMERVRFPDPSEITGPEVAGSETSGAETSGAEISGSETQGSEIGASEAAEPEVTGTETAGSGTADPVEVTDHVGRTEHTGVTDRGGPGHGDRGDHGGPVDHGDPVDHGMPGDSGHDHQHPGVAAARRRHPSEPDFTLRGEPVVPAQTPLRAKDRDGHEQTVGRLAELAEARTPLSDVRQGPLGTLDVYLFQDGTTVCLSPGHRETAEALCEALRDGDVPVLMGGSTVSGAYALTFAYGEGRTAYLLADRVIASR